MEGFSVMGDTSSNRLTLGKANDLFLQDQPQTDHHSTWVKHCHFVFLALLPSCSFIQHLTSEIKTPQFAQKTPQFRVD